MDKKSLCVICEYGWIIKGTQEKCDNDTLTFSNASVVRCWRNGRGIGGIAKKEYKDEYTLDYIGDVSIMKGKILFTIPCEW